MHYLQNTSLDPYFNMAFDEYCLEQGSGEFFYLWRNSPSVIVGLNQNVYSEVNLDFLEKKGILLARRVTGGGAVYHDLQNLNYSIVGRKPGPEPIVEALRALGLDVELSGRNDIFLDGKKVSGYARRVSGGRELIHGTLMYDVDIQTLTSALSVPGSKMSVKGVESVRSRVGNLKEYLPACKCIEDLQSSLTEILSKGDSPLELPPQALDAIKTEAEGKFASREWIYGRSRRGEISTEAHLDCGNINVKLAVDHGEIVEIAFSGDFIGDESPERLERSLIGCPYAHEEIIKALSGLNVERVFQGATAAQIAELLLTRE